jgi:hypothetical protein
MSDSGEPCTAQTITPLRRGSNVCAVEAVLKDGPLKGTKVEIEAVGGRPPSTIELSDPAGEDVRYCLAEWTQEGMSAEYTFLYRV